MKLTIDRATWRCGGGRFNPAARGRGPTKLNNSSSCKCCLGFYTVACGVTAVGIMNVATPGELVNWRKENWKRKGSLMSCLAKLVRLSSDDQNYTNSEYAKEAMGINDNDHISDEVREQRLIELAARNGDEWEFVGKFPD